MADMETLFKQVDALTAEEVKQLYSYIRDHFQPVLEEEAIGTRLKQRILGLHAHLGSAWMSDDFNAELPIEFWLGEDDELSP